MDKNPQKPLFLGLAVCVLLIFVPFWLLKNVPDRPSDAILAGAVITGMIGMLVVFFRWAYEIDKRSKSAGRFKGKRFCRSLASADKAFQEIIPWAEKCGNLRHPSSTEGRLVYARKDYNLYPVYVSVERVQGAGVLEAWVHTGGSDMPIKKGFSLIHSVRKGRDEVNALLAWIGERPID